MMTHRKKSVILRNYSADRAYVVMARAFREDAVKLAEEHEKAVEARLRAENEKIAWRIRALDREIKRNQTGEL